MQYQVPQFIEIEDKIFGPFTFKQFVYIAGGAGLCFMIYRFLPFFIAIVVIIPVAGFSAALAFYKVNNRPFINIVESAIKYFLGDKLYIWKKVEKKADETTVATETAQALLVPKLSNSKLRDLTWSLDINETIYSKQTGFKSKEELHGSQSTSDEDRLSSFKGLSTDMKNTGRF